MGPPPQCHVACTRYNNITIGELDAWMCKYKLDGCVYGSPVPLSPRVLPMERVIVLEMNNETNKVIGVGMIENMASAGRIRIHKNHSYNRYLYKGQHRILVSEMTIAERTVIWIIERLLFYGSHHMKRGYGISLVPHVWDTNPTISFTNCLRQMFLSRWDFQSIPPEMRLWDEGKVVNRCGDLLSYCGEELCGRRGFVDDGEEDDI